MYDVVLSSDAAEVYAAADRPLAKKLARCFRQLQANPRQSKNMKSLKGEWAGYLRYRVGDWLVIFQIDDGTHHVYVGVIAHRSEAYD